MTDDTTERKKFFLRQEALKDNNWSAGSFKNFSFAANSITGFLRTQEDRYVSSPYPNFARNWSYFGVYDGHRGSIVAEYLKRKLHDHILEQFEESEDIQTALEQGFLACDQALRDMKDDEFNVVKEETLKEFFGSEYQPYTTGGVVRMNDRLYNQIKTAFFRHAQTLGTDQNKPSTSLQKQFTEKNDKPVVRRSKSINEKLINQMPTISATVDRLWRFKKGEAACSSSHSDEVEGKNVESLLDEKKTVKEGNPLVGKIMGSTATAVIFTDQVLYVANVGNSKCIASVNGELLVLTQTHIPIFRKEHERILLSGHTVTDCRVGGTHPVSRGFGDFNFKDKKNLTEKEQAITAYPTVKAIPLSDLDFLVIASDGVWDEMIVEAMHVFVERSLYLPLEEIISEIFELILLGRNSGRGLDNMTLIIIKNDARCVKVSDEFINFLNVKTDNDYEEMKPIKTEPMETEIKEEENIKVETKKTKTRKSETKSKKAKIVKK